MAYRIGLVAAFFICLSLIDWRLKLSTRLPVRGDVKPSAVPLEVGDWVGHERKLNERLLGDREAVIERTYVRKDGTKADLIVVYSRNWRNIHPPEMCLTAIGWRLVREFTIDLALPDGTRGMARGLTMHRSDGTLAGLYVYVDRGVLTDSWPALFSRMLDRAEKVRALVGVYAHAPVTKHRAQIEPKLIAAAKELATLLLPHIIESMN